MSYQPDPETQPTAEPTTNQERSELMAELQQLGQQLESTFKAFVAGPGQTIRREVTEAFQELGTQVQRAVAAVQEKPQTAELEQKARRALHQATEKPFVREVEETLVTGVQQINTQLRKLVDRMESQAPQQSATGPTQKLYVEDESGLGESNATTDRPTTQL